MAKAKKKSTKKDAEPTTTTTALTKADEKKLQKAADQRWKETTENLRNRRRQAAADIIQYRYDVGTFAIELMEDRAKELGKKLYGDRTVEQLCEALAESSSTVHTCIKFARKCNAKELEYFKKHEWPWRAISSIVTVEDAETYKQLKEDFEKGRFQTSEELKQNVKAVNAQAKADGTKTDKRGGSPTTKSTIKSFNTSCKMLSTKVMPNFMEAVQKFAKEAQKMDAESAEAVAKDLEESKEALDTLTKMATRANEILGEIDV